MKWHVVSWTGTEMYGGKRFKSFEDARDYITEMSYKLCDTEEERTGYEEDMYAEEIA